MKGLIFSILTVFLSLGLFAQHSVKFDSYGIEDGLSQSFVTDIIQDDLGNIWFSTQDGLNKFNGYKFEVYKTRLNDSTSIPNNYLHSLTKDKSGQLWFGTNRGIAIINPRTGEIQKINRNNYSNLKGYIFTSLVLDKRNYVWALSEKHGINMIDQKTKKVRVIGSLDNSSDFSTLFIDQNERLWVGTKSGRVFYSGFPYADFKELKSNDLNLKSAVNTFSDYKDSSIIICSETGVYTVDSDLTLSYFSEFPEIQYQNFTSVFVESEENIWLGTKGYGLYLLKNKNNINPTLFQYTTNPYNTYSLCDNYINSIYPDQSGNIWIGTEKGIAKFDVYKQGFTIVGINNNPDKGLIDQYVWSFNEDRNNNIYVGTKKDLTIYNPVKNKFFHYYRNEKNEHYLTNIYPETPNRIWLGFDDGLFLLEIESSTKYNFKKIEFMENSLDQNIRVYQIIPYKGNKLWIGSRAGLALIDKTTLEYEFFLPSNLSNSIGDGAIKVIYRDMKNNYWFVTNNDGLYKMVEEDNQPLFIPYAIPETNSHVTSIIQTDTNHLWLGTYGEGLIHLNLNSGKTTNYREVNGLANNVIYGLLSDEDNNIWISTNKGLSQFIVTSNKFVNYTTTDGLPSNEFNTNAYFKDSRNNLYFGSIKGYTKFNVKNITINPIRPRVIISDIIIHDKQKNVNKNNIHNSGNSDSIYLELPYHQNDISFEFFSSHFSNPEKNTFKFMLEGYDEDFKYLDDDNKVHYMNLEHDEYVFNVFGKNPDGVWSEKPAKVYLKITPPFWLTWWFRILSFAAIVVIIFYVYQIRVAQIRRQKVRLELEVVKRTRKISEQNKQIIEQNTQVELQKGKIEHQKELLQKEKEKVEGILLNILPEGTAAELINKGKSKARYYKRVTVMFTDFVGFSKIAENMKPQDLVRQLDSYFTNFDKIISKFDLEKIKTIGDAYMCAGGVPIRNKSNAIEVVLAALAIQDFMKSHNAKIKEKGKDPWEIRIGINTGEVTAGVIGQKRFAYDIWGSTVNQAQRMEMHGQPNHVNVSGNTYEIIAPYFVCTYRGKIQTKHNGTLDMYFVDGIKPELSVKGEGKSPNKKFWQIVDLHIYSSINYMKAERHIMKVLEEQLSENLHYHSIRHTKDVTEAAERIALMEGITDEDLFLLKSAASYHDAGFVEKYDKNEEIGMRMARETLPKYGYTQSQIDVIDGLIKATEIPQSPKNLLEQIMCDADLDYLGRDDFHQIADLLRRELREHGKINSDRLWDEIQVKFLTQHTYFTKSAIASRQKKKMKHLEEIKEKLKTYNYKD